MEGAEGDKLGQGGSGNRGKRESRQERESKVKTGGAGGLSRGWVGGGGCVWRHRCRVLNRYCPG